MNTPVRVLLRGKEGAVVTASPDATVYECIETMVDANVGSIVLVEGDDLAGIFTERDYLRRIVLQGRTSKTTTVRDVMTADVITVTPSTTIEDALARMTKARCRHLPVVVDDRLVGIVSIGDCVKHLLRSAQADVTSLKGYVQGRYPA